MHLGAERTEETSAEIGERPFNFTWWFMEGREQGLPLPRAFEIQEGLLNSIRQKVQLKRRQDSLEIAIGKLFIRRNAWVVEPKTRQRHLELYCFETPQSKGMFDTDFFKDQSRDFDLFVAGTLQSQEEENVGALILIGQSPVLIIRGEERQNPTGLEMLWRKLKSKAIFFNRVREENDPKQMIERGFRSQLEAILQSFGSLHGVAAYQPRNPETPNVLERFS